MTDILTYGPAPESADAALQWIADHDATFGHFIDGSWVLGTGHFETFNPATAQVLATIAQGTVANVDRAVSAARAAQPGWAANSGHARARVLYAVARQVQKHARLFAVLETLDNGKPIRETRDIDIPLVARHFYHHAGRAQTMSSTLPNAEPVGVCGQIIPWNFPLLMLAWKIAPALAMGNTVVLKPAEFTPLTALLFAEICEAAGVPAGVVNIVTGDGTTGAAIVEHPGVDKIAFTGSTEVGRHIRRETAGSGKKLSLELGGKSPFIVFEDADLDSAIEGIVDAIWLNQGQVCCAGSRLLVQESIEKAFLSKLRARMSKLRVGSPLDKSVDLGAIIAPVQRDRICQLVDQGVQEGATLFQPELGPVPEGWFYPPTLLTDVHPSATVAQVEIFGPVLVAMSFRTPKEAVDLANNTPYGLAASIWTENIGIAHEVAHKIKAGTIWVNCTNQFDAASGFGGYRESGYGREGGREGLMEYVRFAEAEPLPAPALVRSRTSIDQTHKLYIGGKQARPDGGYSVSVHGKEFALAGRKDVRNAVEAARGAQAAWQAVGGHARAQVLYYLAENLEAEWGLPEVTSTLFEYAARADKLDGQVHGVPGRQLVYSLNEPVGVIAIVAPDESSPVGLVSLIAAAVAAGNSVIVLASESDPLAAVSLYRVIEASDVPAGVVNILTGQRKDVVPTLADHDDIDAIWVFGALDERADVERRSTGNLKQVWSADNLHHTPDEALRHALQVKNVWVPFGS